MKKYIIIISVINSTLCYDPAYDTGFHSTRAPIFNLENSLNEYSCLQKKDSHHSFLHNCPEDKLLQSLQLRAHRTSDCTANSAPSIVGHNLYHCNRPIAALQFAKWPDSKPTSFSSIQPSLLNTFCNFIKKYQKPVLHISSRALAYYKYFHNDHSFTISALPRTSFINLI